MKYFQFLLYFCCICCRPFGECYSYPEIHLGEVDLSSNPRCEAKMQPYLNRCTNEYRYNVQKAMERANNNESSELVRRVTCCGIWTAKYCMSRAARSQPECDIKEARAFEKLPIDSDAIAVMNRQCRGLYHTSRQCSAAVSVNYISSEILFLSLLFYVFIVRRLGIWCLSFNREEMFILISHKITYSVIIWIDWKFFIYFYTFYNLHQIVTKVYIKRFLVK